jgi:nicotinic acid mononucleotide adenylyltransferase
MGADQFAKLDTGTARRREEAREDRRVRAPGVQLAGEGTLSADAPMPHLASEIRARVGRGEDISALVPPAVANYVAAQALRGGH